MLKAMIAQSKALNPIEAGFKQLEYQRSGEAMYRPSSQALLQ
jgi:hypothetical protein